MDKDSRIIWLVAAILAAGAAAVILWPQPEQVEQLVGADQDAHGCIGSAGYLWCAPKEKCLRLWEEACYESVKQEIQHILADKYAKDPSEVNITMMQSLENFASGSVAFGTGSEDENGIFLARSQGLAWEVVYDGNGSVDCAQMRDEFGFPDSILQPNFCD